MGLIMPRLIASQEFISYGIVPYSTRKNGLVLCDVQNKNWFYQKDNEFKKLYFYEEHLIETIDGKLQSSSEKTNLIKSSGDLKTNYLTAKFSKNNIFNFDLVINSKVFCNYDLSYLTIRGYAAYKNLIAISLSRNNYMLSIVDLIDVK